MFPPDAMINKYLSIIKKLVPKEVFNKADLLIDSFLIEQENDIRVYFAPAEYCNEKARVILLGITPGWTQMEIGFRRALSGITRKENIEEICRSIKQEAAFAGSMRRNLCDMLDGLALPNLLGIESSNDLFNKHSDLIHSTSAFRYPVFFRGQNYTGHKPKWFKIPILRHTIENRLSTELSFVPNAVIIPLGKAVDEALTHLSNINKLDPKRCLFGFPHPSGANAHRTEQYQSKKCALKKRLKIASSYWL